MPSQTPNTLQKKEARLDNFELTSIWILYQVGKNMVVLMQCDDEMLKQASNNDISKRQGTSSR